MESFNLQSSTIKDSHCDTKKTWLRINKNIIAAIAIGAKTSIVNKIQSNFVWLVLFFCDYKMLKSLL